jgi:hypothetical protein
MRSIPTFASVPRLGNEERQSDLSGRSDEKRCKEQSAARRGDRNVHQGRVGPNASRSYPARIGRALRPLDGVGRPCASAFST